MSPRHPGPAKAKILEAATCLFYEQGYRATTVDQVIEKSGVSKPTVYSHFPTKEVLCVAYLRDLSRHELDLLRGAVRKEKTARARFMAVIKHVRNRVIEADFRGCGFFNMISEMADSENPIAKEAKLYVDAIRAVIREVVIELLDSDEGMRGVDVDELADGYYLIVAGAIMASQEYLDRWPADRAVGMVEKLLER